MLLLLGTTFGDFSVMIPTIPAFKARNEVDFPNRMPISGNTLHHETELLVIFQKRALLPSPSCRS